jgi:hypothetical protein
MSIDNDRTSTPNLGHAFIQTSLLDRLSRFWEGPLHPNDIADVELVIRAFLVSNKMSGLKIGTVGREEYEPFGDGSLDALFVDSGFLLSPDTRSIRLSGEEEEYLQAFYHGGNYEEGSFGTTSVENERGGK